MITKVLHLLPEFTFALSIVFIRNTVVCLIEGSPNTFYIWDELKKRDIYFKLRFFVKAIRASFYKGTKVEGSIYGDYKYENDLIAMANGLGASAFVESKRLLAAGKACVWASLAVWSAYLTIGLKLLKYTLYF